MPKKRPARKPPAKKEPPPIDAATIDAAELLLVTTRSLTQVAVILRDKFHLDDAEAAAAIDAARGRLAVTAGFDAVEQLGKAITRIDDLYRRSIELTDPKTALACQKTLNNLLDLNRRPDDPAAAAAQSEAQLELAEVRAYLEPLKLGKPTDSTAELARRAVNRIVNVKT